MSGNLHWEGRAREVKDRGEPGCPGRPESAWWLLTQGGLDLDAPHGLLDALEEVLVLRVLIALLVGVHVGEGADIGVKILLTYRLLENTTGLARPIHAGAPGFPEAVRVDWGSLRPRKPTPPEMSAQTHHRQHSG